MINYCLPIIKNKKADVLTTIEQNEKEYQFFEVWLDYIKNFDEAFLTQLINLLGEKLIVVFRRQHLEKPMMDQQKRLTMLALLKNADAIVDLDISQAEELKTTNNNLLLSYHNYDNTPSNDALQKIITTMEQYHPTIYKIATMCQTEQDALRLLELQQALKQQNKKHIVLGMGEYGTITRIFGTLWGNEMIFAPKEKSEASAPGQLTKEQLEKILKRITKE